MASLAGRRLPKSCVCSGRVNARYQCEISKRTWTSAVGFAGDPVVIAVHPLSISGFTAVDRRGTGGASIVAAAPIVAFLWGAFSDDAGFHTDISCDIQCGGASLGARQYRRNSEYRTKYAGSSDDATDRTATRASVFSAPVPVIAWLVVMRAFSHDR